MQLFPDYSRISPCQSDSKGAEVPSCGFSIPRDTFLGTSHPSVPLNLGGVLKSTHILTHSPSISLWLNLASFSHLSNIQRQSDSTAQRGAASVANPPPLASTPIPQSKPLDTRHVVFHARSCRIPSPWISICAPGTPSSIGLPFGHQSSQHQEISRQARSSSKKVLEHRQLTRSTILTRNNIRVCLLGTCLTIF